jgi:hypothetical protein
MLLVVTAQTVVLTVDSEDGFREGEHMPGRLKPGNAALISLDDSPTQRSTSLWVREETASFRVTTTNRPARRQRMQLCQWSRDPGADP